MFLDIPDRIRFSIGVVDRDTDRISSTKYLQTSYLLETQCPGGRWVVPKHGEGRKEESPQTSWMPTVPSFRIAGKGGRYSKETGESSTEWHRYPLYYDLKVLKWVTFSLHLILLNKFHNPTTLKWLFESVTYEILTNFQINIKINFQWIIKGRSKPRPQ